MTRGKRTVSIDEINRTFKEKFQAATSKPTVYNYKPHDKQIQFHSSTEDGRLYIGGNRSGKLLVEL